MKIKILAVDDSKAIRFLLQSILHAKYEVVAAADGSAAMHWLNQKSLPGLIIANVQLPDMKDWEWIAYLVSSGLYGNIPILALSALDPDETQQKCNALQINKYFLKPFNPVDLVKAVDKIITLTSVNQYPVKVL